MAALPSDFEWLSTSASTNSPTLNLILFEKWFLSFFDPHSYEFESQYIPILDKAGTSLPIEVAVTLYEYYLFHCPVHYFAPPTQYLISPIQLTKAKIIKAFAPLITASLSTSVANYISLLHSSTSLPPTNTNLNPYPQSVTQSPSHTHSPTACPFSPSTSSHHFTKPSTALLPAFTFYLESPNPLTSPHLHTQALSTAHNLHPTLASALHSLLLTSLRYGQPANHTLAAYMEKKQFSATSTTELPSSLSPIDPSTNTANQNNSIDLQYIVSARYTAALSLQLLVWVMKFVALSTFYELLWIPDLYTSHLVSLSTISLLTTSQYNHLAAQKQQLAITPSHMQSTSSTPSSFLPPLPSSIYALVQSLLVPYIYTALMYYPQHNTNFIYKSIPSLQHHDDVDLSFEFRYSSHRNAFAPNSFEDQLWQTRELALLSMQLVYLGFFALFLSFNPHSSTSQSVLEQIGNNLALYDKGTCDQHDSESNCNVEPQQPHHPQQAGPLQHRQSQSHHRGPPKPLKHISSLLLRKFLLTSSNQDKSKPTPPIADISTDQLMDETDSRNNGDGEHNDIRSAFNSTHSSTHNPFPFCIHISTLDTFISFIFSHIYAPVYAQAYPTLHTSSSLSPSPRSPQPSFTSPTGSHNLPDPDSTQSTQSTNSTPTPTPSDSHSLLASLFSTQHYYSHLYNTSSTYFNQHINEDNVFYALPMFPSYTHLASNENFIAIYPTILSILCRSSSSPSSPSSRSNLNPSEPSSLNSLNFKPTFLSMRYLVTHALRTLVELTNPYLLMQLSTLLTLSPSSWLYTQFRDTPLTYLPSYNPISYQLTQDQSTFLTTHTPFTNFHLLFTPHPSQFGNLASLFIHNPFESEAFLKNKQPAANDIKAFQRNFGLSLLDYQPFEKLHEQMDPRMQQALNKLKNQEEKSHSTNFFNRLNVKESETGFFRPQRSAYASPQDSLAVEEDGFSTFDMATNYAKKAQLEVFRPDDLLDPIASKMAHSQGRKNGSDDIQRMAVNQLIGIKLFPCLTTIYPVLVTNCADILFSASHHRTLTLRVTDALLPQVDQFSALFSDLVSNSEISNKTTIISPSSHLSLTPSAYTTLQSVRFGLILQPMLNFLKTAEISLFRLTGINLAHHFLKFIKLTASLSQLYHQLVQTEQFVSNSKQYDSGFNPPSLIKPATTDIGNIEFNQADFVSTTTWEFFFIHKLFTAFALHQPYNSVLAQPDRSHTQPSQNPQPGSSLLQNRHQFASALHTFIMSSTPSQIHPQDTSITTRTSRLLTHHNATRLDPSTSLSITNVTLGLVSSSTGNLRYTHQQHTHEQIQQNQLANKAPNSPRHDSASQSPLLFITTSNFTTIPHVISTLQLGKLFFSTLSPLISFRTQALSHFYSIFAFVDAYSLLFNTNAKGFILEPVISSSHPTLTTTHLCDQNFALRGDAAATVVETASPPSSSTITTTTMIQALPPKPYPVSDYFDLDTLFITTPAESNYLSTTSSIVQFILEQYKFIPTMDSELGGADTNKHLVTAFEMVYKIYPERPPMDKLFYYIPDLCEPSHLETLVRYVLGELDTKREDIDTLINHAITIPETTLKLTSLTENMPRQEHFTMLQEELISTVFRPDYTLFSAIPSQVVFNEAIQHIHQASTTYQEKHHHSREQSESSQNKHQNESHSHHGQSLLNTHRRDYAPSLSSSLYFYPLAATPYHITVQTLLAQIHLCSILSPSSLSNHFAVLLTPLFQFCGISDDHHYKYQILIKSLALDGINLVLNRLLYTNLPSHLSTPYLSLTQSQTVFNYITSRGTATNALKPLPHLLLVSRSYEFIESILMICIDHSTAFHPFFNLTSWFLRQHQAKSSPSSILTLSPSPAYSGHKNSVFTLFSVLLHGTQGKSLTFVPKYQSRAQTRSPSHRPIDPTLGTEDQLFNPNTQPSSHLFNPKNELQKLASNTKFANSTPSSEYADEDARANHIIDQFLQNTAPKDMFEQYSQSLLFSTNTTPNILLSTIATTNYKLHGWNGEGLAFDINHLNRMLRGEETLPASSQSPLDSNIDEFRDIPDVPEIEALKTQLDKVERLLSESDRPPLAAAFADPPIAKTPETLELNSKWLIDESNQDQAEEEIIFIPGKPSTRKSLIEICDSDSDNGGSDGDDGGNSASSMIDQTFENRLKSAHDTSNKIEVFESQYLQDKDRRHNVRNQQDTHSTQSKVDMNGKLLISEVPPLSKPSKSPNSRTVGIIEVIEDISLEDDPLSQDSFQIHPFDQNIAATSVLAPSLFTSSQLMLSGTESVQRNEKQAYSIETAPEFNPSLSNAPGVARSIASDDTNSPEYKVLPGLKCNTKRTGNHNSSISPQDDPDAETTITSQSFNSFAFINSYQSIPIDQYTLQSTPTVNQSSSEPQFGPHPSHPSDPPHQRGKVDNHGVVQVEDVQWAINEDLLLSEFSFLFSRFSHLLSILFSSTIKWKQPNALLQHILSPHNQHRHPRTQSSSLPPTITTTTTTTEATTTNSLRHAIPCGESIALFQALCSDDWSDRFNPGHNAQRLLPKLLVEVQAKTTIAPTSHSDPDPDQIISSTVTSRLYSIDEFVQLMVDPNLTHVVEPFSQRKSSSQPNRTKTTTTICQFVLALTQPKIVCAGEHENEKQTDSREQSSNIIIQGGDDRDQNDHLTFDLDYSPNIMVDGIEYLVGDYVPIIPELSDVCFILFLELGLY